MSAMLESKSSFAGQKGKHYLSLFSKVLKYQQLFFSHKTVFIFSFSKMIFDLFKKKKNKTQNAKSLTLILHYLNQVLLCQVQCILFHCPRT